MPLSVQNEVAVQIPEGYAVIPVSAEQAAASLRIVVLVREEPDPVGGHLVVLRHTMDARVLLGAISDSEGQIHRWIELWVQTLDDLTTRVPYYVQNLSNDMLDRRWVEQVESLEALDRSSVIRAGWESTHPSPMFLDIKSKNPVHPADSKSGQLWQLCRDDELLTEKQLPRYSTSLHRYLYLASAGSDSSFVPTTSDAPTQSVCRPLSEILDSSDSPLIPLNPSGGLMLVRPFYPLGYESLVDLVSGGTWTGVPHGKSVINVGLPSPENTDEESEGGLSDGWLWMGAKGRWGRLSEALHIKLRALADAAAAVRTLTERTQKPFFNLAPQSFRVSMGQTGAALPCLWSAIPNIVDPGAAIALRLQTSDWQYYLPGRDSGRSIYHPRAANQYVEGKGDVRIREVLIADGTTITLEGTLTTEEDIKPDHHDLARLQLSLSGEKVELFAHMDREKAMAPGEWRFRTIEQRIRRDQQTALRAAEGVPMTDTPFEIMPLLSSPCDLYALGVIAIHTLLVNKDTKLPVALDEVLSLARQVAINQKDGVDLATQIASIFGSDDRWMAALGPHHLTHEAVDPQEVFDVIPPQLWWEVLAMMIRMFPGTSPFCPCRDFGDAPQAGIHRIYEPLLQDLDMLLLRTRSLIVIDWKFNREVHTVLRQFTVGVESR